MEACITSVLASTLESLRCRHKHAFNILVCTVGGCFWGVELAFQRVPGVLKTSVGYTAGHDQSPTYNSVCSGQTGHTEAVQACHHLVFVTVNSLCNDCVGYQETYIKFFLLRETSAVRMQ